MDRTNSLPRSTKSARDREVDAAVINALSRRVCDVVVRCLVSNRLHFTIKSLSSLDVGRGLSRDVCFVATFWRRTHDRVNTQRETSTTYPSQIRASHAVMAKPEDLLFKVCRDEAYQWLDCLEPMALETKTVKVTMENACTAQRAVFDECVVAWRAANDPQHLIHIKGSGPGLPPPQCAPLSCLSEKCLFATGFDFKQCTAFMGNFKHCVKALYVKSEFVD